MGDQLRSAAQAVVEESNYWQDFYSYEYAVKSPEIADLRAALGAAPPVYDAEASIWGDPPEWLGDEAKMVFRANARAFRAMRDAAPPAGLTVVPCDGSCFWPGESSMQHIHASDGGVYAAAPPAGLREARPHCDICDWPQMLNCCPAHDADWNGETGNHISCEEERRG